MPKHKTSTFHWMTWEVNAVCLFTNLITSVITNLASLCHITKEKISSKFFTKTATWKLVPGPFVFAKNEA